MNCAPAAVVKNSSAAAGRGLSSINACVNFDVRFRLGAVILHWLVLGSQFKVQLCSALAACPCGCARAVRLAVGEAVNYPIKDVKNAVIILTLRRMPATITA